MKKYYKVYLKQSSLENTFLGKCKLYYKQQANKQLVNIENWTLNDNVTKYFHVNILTYISNINI